jgi:hypothetical protein
MYGGIAEGLPITGLERPLDVWRPDVEVGGRLEIGPLVVLLAPSPKPTRLAFPSSDSPPMLDTPSSLFSLILSAS